MAQLRPREHDEIYESAKKYIALYESIDRKRFNESSNREDLHYMADKLKRNIEHNIQRADQAYDHD